MGCSASRSRPHTFIVTASDDHSSSTSSPSYSSSPFPKTLSRPTTLVHHPPLRKGDTHHLVCLTSSTYGSLLLIDPKGPNLTPTGDPSHSPPVDPTESLSPDSVINAWELMDGLNDDFDNANNKAAPFHRPAESWKKPISFHYLGTNLAQQQMLGAVASVKSKPLWQHLSEEALLAKMDPIVAASYMRALSSKQLAKNPIPQSPRKPETSDRIVLYFTSLRGIRKTYEDCCSVQMILRGFRVPIDERDISMDSEFKRELQQVLGGKAMSLPQVFVRGKHIGGADEITRLNEAGELAKLLEGFPILDRGFVCERCGDARFVPCPHCNGSRKIFQGQLRKCQHCNENGLLRCPTCCS